MNCTKSFFVFLFVTAYSCLFAQGKQGGFELNLIPIKSKYIMDETHLYDLTRNPKIMLPELSVAHLKGKFYQEFIFPGIHHDKTMISSKNDPKIVIEKRDFGISLNYLIGWKWLGSTDSKWRGISGLGLNFEYRNEQYKRTDYGIKVTELLRNKFVYSPAIFTRVDYQIHGPWRANFALQLHIPVLYNEVAKSSWWTGTNMAEVKRDFWEFFDFGDVLIFTGRLGITYTIKRKN